MTVVTAAAPEPVVIGLGGNVGTEAAIIERFDRARAALAVLDPRGQRGVRSAQLFRTAPIGPDQVWFLNTAVQITPADQSSGEMIAALLEIEGLLGRRRETETRWGPRPIDLDVLVWGVRTIHTPELCVPHPRLVERRFALLPLIDLVGEDFVVPGSGPLAQLARRVSDQACELVAAAW